MNSVTASIRAKGYLLSEFLTLINRSERWYRTHSIKGAKHYGFLLMAIKGMDDKGEVSKQVKKGLSDD